MYFVPSSFIIPGLNDHGAFGTLPGKGRVVVMEKPKVSWLIFCLGAQRGRSWKLLRHLSSCGQGGDLGQAEAQKLKMYMVIRTVLSHAFKSPHS